MVARGWGRLQLGDDEELTGDSADLSLLYLEGRAGPIALRLGRQHIVSGVGRMEIIDGANITAFLPAGLSLQGFFGATTPEEFDYASGAFQGGGRLAVHFDVPGEVGVSYRHVRLDGELDREELGVDGYVQAGIVRVLANAAYAPRESALVEGRGAVSVLACHKDDRQLRITVDYERVRPDLLLSRTSIFAVFADAGHDAFGGDVYWAPSAYYDVMAEGHGLLLDGDTLGYRATLRARAFREPNHRSFVGAELRRVDEQDNAYLRGRAFTALQLIDPLRVAADAYAYSYDEQINGVTNSYLGTLSLVWDIGPSMQLAGSTGMGKTPSAEFQLEGLLRFTYGYGLDLGREVGP